MSQDPEGASEQEKALEKSFAGPTIMEQGATREGWVESDADNTREGR
jgi:hypothetical protein